MADPGVVWVLAYGVRDTGPSPDRPGLHRYALGSPETLTAGGPPAPRFVDGSPRFALDGLTQLSPFAHLVVDREDPTLLRRAVEVQQHLTARFLLDCDGELTGVLQAYARDRLRLDGAVVASIARDPAGPTARDLVAHASPRLPSFEELPPLQRAIPELPMGIVADLGLRQVTLDVPRGWPEQALLASRSPRAWLDLLGLGGQSREITLRHERGQPLELWLAEVEPPRDAFHAPYGRVLSLTAEQLAGTQPLRLRVRPALSSYAAFQACARTGGPCVEVV